MIRLLTAISALLVAAPAFAQVDPDKAIKGPKGPGPITADLFNTPKPDTKPKRGGTVTQAMLAGPRVLDTDMDSSAVTSEIIHTYVLENLVDNDWETWKEIPSLAESWDTHDVIVTKGGEKLWGDVAEDGGGYSIKLLDGGGTKAVKKDDVKEVRLRSAFTFHVRKGVKFHDGTTLDAHDVEWTYKLLGHEKNGMESIRNYMKDIDEIKLIDDFTIRMAYSRQYWMALQACCYGYIRSRESWDPDNQLEKDPDAFFKKFQEHPLLQAPPGTGPYKVQKDGFKRDFHVKLERWDGYWDKNKPQYPDEIHFRFINDSTAQLKALEAGEIDLTWQIPPPTYFDWFGDDPKIKGNSVPVEYMYTAYQYVGWNCSRELFRDKTVRQALAYGMIDLDKFIKDTLRGKAIRCTNDYYMFSPSYNKELKPWPYKPEKAKELLEEAGWFDTDGDGVIDKDGKPFRFELLHRTMPETNPAWQRALIYQENLKKLGIDMQIRKVDWATLLDHTDKADFDATTLAWALSTPPDHLDLYQLWHSTCIGGKGSNHVSFANEKLDKLLEDCRKELDEKKRNDIERAIQALLADEQPYYWLFYPAELSAYSKKWRNVKFYVIRPGRRLNEWYQSE